MQAGKKVLLLELKNVMTTAYDAPANVWKTATGAGPTVHKKYNEANPIEGLETQCGPNRDSTVCAVIEENKIQDWLLLFDDTDFAEAIGTKIGPLQIMWKGYQSPGKVMDWMVQSFGLKIASKRLPQRKTWFPVLALLQARVLKNVKPLPALPVA